MTEIPEGIVPEGITAAVVFYGSMDGGTPVDEKSSETTGETE